MDKKPIIEFKNFSFQYDAQAAPTLNEINLAIYPGEKVLIIGASGSGKSTLGKCLNGLIPQIDAGNWQGEVIIQQQQLGAASVYDFSLEVGTVLQDTDGQFVGLTVAEDMAFALENDQVPQVKMKALVKEWADRLTVSDLLSEKPQNLSGGQKQRVSLAGVLIDETPILLFDEPLASLDPKTGHSSITLIDQLHRHSSVTTVIIEHRLEDVLACEVDRIILLDQGRIIADQKPDQLLRSGILTRYGIREPLYLTALKAADVDLSTIADLQSIHSIQGLEIGESLSKWQANHQFIEPTKKQEPLLELNQLSFSYPGSHRQILNELDLTIHHGEMLSLVGANGTGKSTLTKLICGFYSPTSGTLIWQGKSLAEQSIKERAEKIGLIMQNPNQMISQNKIFDEVALGLVNRGWDGIAIQEKVLETLKICGLYPFRNWPISALSYGQKKRVTIASILVLEPDLLILDEPTAGQDQAHYTEMMTFLQELNARGKTILIITHDMHLMQEYTERTIVLSQGQVLADQSPAKILTNEQLIQEASLKATSLYTLAKQGDLADPVQFVETFIQQERLGGIDG